MWCRYHRSACLCWPLAPWWAGNSKMTNIICLPWTDTQSTNTKMWYVEGAWLFVGHGLVPLSTVLRSSSSGFVVVVVVLFYLFLYLLLVDTFTQWSVKPGKGEWNECMPLSRLRENGKEGGGQMENVGKREGRTGSMMLLNLYCEIYEICVFNVNKLA